MAKNDGAEPGAGLFSALFQLAREAITDIRQEVVERGWFGAAAEVVAEVRELPDTPVGIALQIAFTPTELASPALDETGSRAAPGDWDTLCKQLSQERGHQPEPSHEHEHGMDR